MLSKVRTVFLVLFLLGSLALNVATVTVQSVALGVSAVVSAVAGASAVLPEFRTVKYRGQSKRLVEAVEDTSKRIAKRTVAAASWNAGSVVAEAIPVAGVAVVLGVTAWDLKDSCDTMADLYVLEQATVNSSDLEEDARRVCGLEVPSKEEVWASIKASPGKAWNAAGSYIPDLPDMPDLPTLPSIDWQSYIPEMPKLPEMPELPSTSSIDWTFWD